MVISSVFLTDEILHLTHSWSYEVIPFNEVEKNSLFKEKTKQTKLMTVLCLRPIVVDTGALDNPTCTELLRLYFSQTKFSRKYGICPPPPFPPMPHKPAPHPTAIIV
jgi:hypothetical protein